MVKVLGFLPDDPTVNATLYLTDDPLLQSNCSYDFETEGQGGLDAAVGATFGFRIMFSELIDGDQVEALDEDGVGDAVYPGFIQITNRDGSTVTSDLDQTMQLTPDMLWSVYQPAGGTGCFGTIETWDIVYGNPLMGPALITYLDGVWSLPSNSTLALWVKKENGGRKIIDTGDTPMAADFKVEFTTDPMYAGDDVMPSVNPADQPVDPMDEDLGFDMVTVLFNTYIGDPSGVYLYDEADPTAPVPDVVPEVDSYIPDSWYGGVDTAVSLTMGIDPDTETYIPIDFTPGATYWIIVTDEVLDLWGVPAVAVDETCADAATAGVDVANCIWAGTFTVADAV